MATDVEGSLSRAAKQLRSPAQGLSQSAANFRGALGKYNSAASDFEHTLSSAAGTEMSRRTPPSRTHDDGTAELISNIVQAVKAKQANVERWNRSRQEEAEAHAQGMSETADRIKHQKEVALQGDIQQGERLAGYGQTLRDADHKLTSVGANVVGGVALAAAAPVLPAALGVIAPVVGAKLAFGGIQEALGAPVQPYSNLQQAAGQMGAAYEWAPQNWNDQYDRRYKDWYARYYGGPDKKTPKPPPPPAKRAQPAQKPAQPPPAQPPDARAARDTASRTHNRDPPERRNEYFAGRRRAPRRCPA